MSASWTATRNAVLRKMYNVYMREREENQPDMSEKKEVLDYYISPIRDEEYDITQGFTSDELGNWSIGAFRADIITLILKEFDSEKLCPMCFEKGEEFVDYVERMTMPDVMVVKCKNGHQYGYTG